MLEEDIDFADAEYIYDEVLKMSENVIAGFNS